MVYVQTKREIKEKKVLKTDKTSRAWTEMVLIDLRLTRKKFRWSYIKY